MNLPEQIQLDVDAVMNNIVGGMKAGVNAAPKGVAIGAAVAIPFAVLRNGLRVARNEIDTEEAILDGIQEIGGAALAGGIAAFVVAGAVAVCPPIGGALVIKSSRWCRNGTRVFQNLSRTRGKNTRL